ncbi:MAG: hypothetical protein UT24_C0021G0003 [Candidatus Woesebacteria bacterium GW2011_GWB1_39_12]|uniref:Uncharacterized protein n=1 Tax=Candidatus Woesebacteria bacterium GW2011_GWB1_39_12 TaxID=1618574 RepID=A0A0G0PP35_9BACT|nr:MAG: hypothetical protein UT24_C0021G0003 [Candidatus Woesebacteria bacterium GW2011_GWB1_39_12]
MKLAKFIVVGLTLIITEATLLAILGLAYRFLKFSEVMFISFVLFDVFLLGTSTHKFSRNFDMHSVVPNQSKQTIEVGGRKYEFSDEY